MANESNPVATKVGGQPLFGRAISTGTATDATGQLLLTVPRQTTWTGTISVSIMAGTTAPTGTPSVTISVEGAGGIPNDEDDIFYTRIPLTANYIATFILPDVVIAARQAPLELRMEQVGVLGTTPEIVAIALGVQN